MTEPTAPLAHTYLRAWRNHREKTLENVAEALGRYHTTIGRWEAGEVKIREADLAKLAKLYAATPHQLRFPPEQAEIVRRLDRLQEIVFDMDTDAFEEYLKIGRRYRKSRTD